MPSALDPETLFVWCRIPTSELENHPQAKVKIKIMPAPDDVHRFIADDMLEELKRNNAEGQPTRWILPCGPTRQYLYFLKAVNEQRISLHGLHVFHMDNCLDWQGRPLHLDHPFSFQGWMLRNFYALMDPELAVPQEQRYFPDAFHIDEISENIARVGGIDTTYGGMGYRGHIAFNEPPRSPWYTITVEEFGQSKTRFLNLNDDTLIALSQRMVGGCSHIVPPMAITLGMKDLLSAKRVRIFSDTGSWKQTAVRVVLFGPVTCEYPVTFIQGHTDSMLVVDQITAAPPLTD
jgi:glucosamine-6-phosphate deaminase